MFFNQEISPLFLPLSRKCLLLPTAGDFSPSSLWDREEPPLPSLLSRKPYQQDTETPP